LNKEFLTSLGFSEKSAEIVSDFLGERVISQPKKAIIKKKETPQIVTNNVE